MSFNWALIESSRDVLLSGMWITLMLSVLAGVLSLILGLALATARLKAQGAIGAVLTAYVELMRNTPLLVTLYLAYFGLPMLGIVIPTFSCMVLVLVMQHSVFVSEIMRGGFTAVPKSQLEAARALGMRPFGIFWIVRFPQAFSASVPALISALIILVHDTSLGAAISLVDLTMTAKIIAQRSASSFEPFIAIAVCYSAISWILSRVGVRFETRAAIVR